jgi:hypothetical protein
MIANPRNTTSVLPNKNSTWSVNTTCEKINAAAPATITRIPTVRLDNRNRPPPEPFPEDELALSDIGGFPSFRFVHRLDFSMEQIETVRRIFSENREARRVEIYFNDTLFKTIYWSKYEQTPAHPDLQP